MANCYTVSVNSVGNRIESTAVCDALISIVVPVYNTRAYLIRCVDSLLMQTHRQLELLLIDDGSTDGSAELLDTYTDPRVRVIHQANAGVSAARNKGIELATGAFIGFVDPDDWVEPRFAERLLQPFAEMPDIDVSICGWYVHRANTVHLGTRHAYGRMTRKEAIAAVLDHSRGFHGYLWNKLFRAELFSAHPEVRLDDDLTICEDLLLCVRLFEAGAAAYDSGEPLYHYQQREDSVLRTVNARRLSEFVARERIAALLRSDETLFHAEELAHVKAAMNLLALAKENRNEPLEADMKRRIDERLPMLLHARDIPLGERIKLAVRRAFPRTSLRIFRSIRSLGGKHGNNL